MAARDFIKKTLPFLKKAVNGGAYTDPNYSCDNVDGFGHKQSKELIQHVATAEIARGYLNLYAVDGNDKWLEGADDACQWLLDRQNEDGSWNEVLQYYNYPSVVASSIAGDVLLLLYGVTKDRKLLESAKRAKDFILNSEVGYGVFRKSTFMLMNTLNVNAHAGAFLAQYAKSAKDKKAEDAARRVIFSVAKHQYTDGAIPYSDSVRSYSSDLHYNVKTIHYQAVSLFYLLKMKEHLSDATLDNTIKKGREYLRRVIDAKGRIKWNKSTFPFEYFQTAAYALSMAVLDKDKDSKTISALMSMLEKERCKDRGFARYQRLGIGYYLGSFRPHMFNTFFAGEFRLKDRLFRTKQFLQKINATRDRKSQLFTTAKIFEAVTCSLRASQEAK